MRLKGRELFLAASKTDAPDITVSSLNTWGLAGWAEQSPKDTLNDNLMGGNLDRFELRVSGPQFNITPLTV